jgi:hypothetical protein
VNVARSIRSFGRLVLGRREPLPDFLCIGAQKAGTTTLYDRLRGHPDLFLPAEKELHYFSRHFDRPIDWYESHFADARSGQRTGEVTPYYLFHPEAPRRIAAVRPHVRLIVLLRDPVERALSGYFHSRRLGEEPLDIEAAFAAEAERLQDAERTLALPGGEHLSHQCHSYFARSRYEEQLARYLRFFPRAQLLILRSEDFFADPRPAWRAVQEFLGVRPVTPCKPSHRRNAGSGEAAAVSRRFRDGLRQRLQPTYDAMRRDHGIEWPGTGEGGGRDVP